MSKHDKKQKINREVYEAFIHFIQLTYEQADTNFPEDFYPEDEAIKISNILRLQGCGISPREIREKKSKKKDDVYTEDEDEE